LYSKIKAGIIEQLVFDSTAIFIYTYLHILFQSLTRIIGKKLMASSEAVHPLIPAEKKVLLTAWLMGNNQSYMAAAKLFEVSKGTVYRIFHHICSELTVLAGKYIQWPDPNECEEISASFENQHGFPGVIGVIGACHVEIREPESQEEAARFRNEQTDEYTVILQAVCDDKLLFRDVCAGFPGQTSKLRVLVGSPLYSRLSSRTDPLIEPHKHILGSSDYPQLSTLLTPYSSNANGRPLTKQELKFNSLHQTARSVVEKAFELLKKRFQRLRFIDVSRTELASKVVVAACVLHNFALMHGDEFTDEHDNKF
jgi:hypothetical protein